MPRKTKEEAELTRVGILNAALDVIYEKGYARSTFVDIAKKIGLTKGAVYWHFKTKPEMFLALGKEMEDKISRALEKMFNDISSLAELKQALFEMILLIAEDEKLSKYYSIVYFRMEWTEEILPIRQFFEQQDSLMHDWVRGTIVQLTSDSELFNEKDLSDLSRALLAFVDGLISHCLTRSETGSERNSSFVRTGLEIFFNGINLHKGFRRS